MTEQQVCNKIRRNKNCIGIDCNDCPFFIDNTCVAVEPVRLATKWLEVRGLLKSKVYTLIDGNTHEELRVVAESKGLNVSDYIRYIIKKELKREQKI